MPKKKKHPLQLRDDEVLDHLFHKDIARAVRKHLKETESEKGAKSQVAKKQRK
jgi:hypothetical protein